MINVTSPHVGPTPWGFAFKPEFHNAPVEHFTYGDSLVLVVAGRVMTKEMYHRLPEYRDWKGLMRGDLAILGRMDLDDDFLDLVVMDAADGYLRSTFIRRDDARAKARNVREFIDQQWNCTHTIRIYENLNRRSTT